MRKITYIILAIGLLSCSKIFEDKVILSDYQYQFLLYDAGEKFSFIRDFKDTITFVVTEKGILGTENRGGTKTGILSFKNTSLTSSALEGKVRIESDNDFQIYFFGSMFTNSSSDVSKNGYENINELLLFEDTVINSVNYKNVFMMNDKLDTLFFSLDKGIIQMKLYQKKQRYDLIEIP